MIKSRYYYFFINNYTNDDINILKKLHTSCKYLLISKNKNKKRVLMCYLYFINRTSINTIPYLLKKMIELNIPSNPFLEYITLLNNSIKLYEYGKFPRQTQAICNKTIRLFNKNINNHNNLKKPEHECICGKKYKYKSGLSRHAKKCNYKEKNINNNQDLSLINKSNNNEEILEQLEKNNELIKKIFDNMTSSTNIQNNHIETINNYKNCNTNNIDFNINIVNYLNTECKDAVMLKDFVDKIKLNIEDIKYVCKNGINKHLECNFFNKIMDMEKIKRPIHCIGKKEQDIYVKDEEGWTFDSSKEKIFESIEKIIKQQIDILNKWKTINSDWNTNIQKQEFINSSMEKLLKIYEEKERKQILNLMKNIYFEIL